MKKLALASVAFAAVATYGAGDAFATVTFLSSAASFTESNDSATWVPNGSNPILGSTGPVASSGSYAITAPPITSSGGVKITGTYNATLAGGSSASVMFGVQNHTPDAVHYAFPTSVPVLYGSTSGSLKLSFSTPVKGVGFYVSPAGFLAADIGFAFDATVEFFGDTTHGDSRLLGTDTVTGHIKTTCVASSCTYIGLDTAGNPGIIGITSVLVEVGSGPGGTNYGPAISSPMLQDAAQPAVPEPGGLSVLGMGLLGLGALRRRRRDVPPRNGWRWSPFGRWRLSGAPPDVLTP